MQYSLKCDTQGSRATIAPDRCSTDYDGLQETEWIAINKTRFRIPVQIISKKRLNWLWGRTHLLQ